MTRTLFWASLATVAATYAVMPALLAVRAALLPRRVRGDDVELPVSIVVAARNEVASIGRKLRNLASLDYPTDLVEVVVASDGSDDGTEDAVAALEPSGVRLLRLPRVGKAEALNRAVEVASGDVVVFTDANSVLAPDALRAIVRPFADPAVGGVAADQRYVDDEPGSAAGGERGYWSADRAIKVLESRAGSVVSATGSLYAIRRSLFREIPAGVTDDFFESTSVVLQGHRLVFSRAAVSYEPPAGTHEAEFARKVRVMTRGFRGVLTQRALLDPRRYGFYAFQLLWHKVLRRLMVAPLAVTALTSALLWPAGPLFRVAAAGQAAVYVLGTAGIALRSRRLGRTVVLAVPAYFCIVNVASVCALWNIAAGRRIDRWEPVRGRTAPAAGPGSSA